MYSNMGFFCTWSFFQDLDAGNITQSTFLFIPQPEDNGAAIVCRAENPWLNRTHILEEIWNLNVVCE